jgi:hypothetical protein
MGQYRCQLLNRKWMAKDSICRPALPGVWPYSPKQAAYWVATSCPSPCAKQAKDKHQNPRAYCKANGDLPVSVCSLHRTSTNNVFLSN